MEELKEDDNIFEETSEQQVSKIFVNWVDTYVGYNISQFLATCTIGSTLEIKDEEEEIKEEESSMNKKLNGYQIFGTLRQGPFDDKPTSHVIKLLPDDEGKSPLLEAFNECQVIIYDITSDPDQVDDAQRAINFLEDNIKDLFDVKIFILISSVLTWLKTTVKQELGSVDEEGEEDELAPPTPLPFTEDDYRRRKPHPNYKKHWLLEKEVVRVGRIRPHKLKCFVVCAGLPYGRGEDIFYYFFRMAWLNSPVIACIGPGRNSLPLIYIMDLALLMQTIIERSPTNPMYILAVESHQTKLENIVKAISETLTTGLIQKLTLENTLLVSELKSRHIDHLTCDLLFQSIFLADTFNFQFSHETGLVGSISNVVKEFKHEHGLLPVRIFVHGPPGSGRQHLVELISSHYKIPVISNIALIQEKLKELRKIAFEMEEAAIMEMEEIEEEEEEEIDEDFDTQTEDDVAILPQKVAEAREQLRMLTESQERNNGQLEPHLLMKILKEKLLSKPCQNQGFVLYGFPDTVAEAKELFAAGEEEIFEDAHKEPIFSTTIMPELVIYLDAPDDFLKETLMGLSESYLVQQYGSEEEVIRKLIEFRVLNTDEDGVLNYFDEREIRIERFDVSITDSLKVIMERIKRILGPPKTLRPTAEELDKLIKERAERQLREEMEEKLRLEKCERDEAIENADLMRDWQKKLADLKLEEEELLQAESLPMRNYLMQNVMPVLTQGLMECVKVRPEDPINFLAEYLFKFTPAGYGSK